MKIYLKRGALNYKEKRLIAGIEKALKEKADAGETPDFQPATNFEELKSLHDNLSTVDGEYEEVGDDSIETKHKEFREGMKDTIEPKKESTGDGFVDPFNDAEPIIRDYVLKDGLEDDKENEPQPTKTTFDEPKSFAESFELPSQEDEKSGASAGKQKKEKTKETPVNSQFDEMSGHKKRRSTKKFAKIIVEGVCILAEKGCIWWTTKEITEDKLVQYELEDKMDLQILLTLDDSQQITVREWFGQKVKEADTLFKVSKEDKEDLIDSLYEVMLEKGVAPTPMQELMINAVKTFILDMGLKAYALNQQIKSVITQLVQIKEQQRATRRDIDFDIMPTPPNTTEGEPNPQDNIVGSELALVETEVVENE